MSDRKIIRFNQLQRSAVFAFAFAVACGTHDDARSTASSGEPSTESTHGATSSSAVAAPPPSASSAAIDRSKSGSAHSSAAQHLPSDCELTVFADVEKLSKAPAFSPMLSKIYEAADRYSKKDPDLAGFAEFARAAGVGTRDVGSVAICARLSHPDAVSISYAVAPSRVSDEKFTMPAPRAGQTAGDVDGAPVLRSGIVTMGRASDGVVVATVSKLVDGYREMLIGDRPPPTSGFAVEIHVGEPLFEKEAGKAPVLKNVVAIGLTVDAKLEHLVVRLQCRSASDAVAQSQALRPEVEKLLKGDLASNPYAVNDTLRAMDVRTEGDDVVADMRIAPSTLSGLAAALDKELP